MLVKATICSTTGCVSQNKTLGGSRKDYAGTLYTLGEGVIPIRIVTLYCRDCKTTYRPNYRVTDAHTPESMRCYYGGIPEYLEVSEHGYVELKLVSLFRSQMAFSHASADAVARIYNTSQSEDALQTPLTSENVWNAFYLHSLLLDKSRHGKHLIVPHHGVQAIRFNSVLAERNLSMAGTGQPHWAHACDVCEKIICADADGHANRISACVMDGVNVGHTRCNVEQCIRSLASPRDRFCPSHQNRTQICAIRGCEQACSDGFRTCLLVAHRALETSQQEISNKAIFRLRARLRNATSVPAKSTSTPPPSAAAPALVPPMKLKSSLTRRWTYNEQLMVSCCGVIKSRATFYEAESLSNAYVCSRFVLATFPPSFPRALPSYLFYDNNCLFLRHLRVIGDTYITMSTGLPVDVFHAVNKHKDTDLFCQMHCNPAGFPELYNDQNEWTFNSSAAEQANVWFGKFLSVVREMTEIHFNFFLDEMILIYNEEVVSRIARTGKHPRLVPVEELSLSRAL
ncbi:hypothetical protein C2E23DRAFT_728888 [Lenzites betulinus]|nr:hypothetical protein C2E23DRAFT_728888 [Lenzites betulinus]